MKSDLSLIDLQGQGSTNTALLGDVESDQARILSLEGPLIHLTLVSATANPTAKQGMPFFNPPIGQGLYCLTSAGSQVGSWAMIDHAKATTGSLVFDKLYFLRVCSHTVLDSMLVIEYKSMFYFLLLEETSPESGQYRRVGVGATWLDHWVEAERRRVDIV